MLLFLKSVTSITLIEVFSKEQLQEHGNHHQQQHQEQQQQAAVSEVDAVGVKTSIEVSSSGSSSGSGREAWYDEGSSSRVHVLASCEVEQPLSDAVAEQRALFLRAAADDPEDEVKGCYSLHLVWR